MSLLPTRSTFVYTLFLILFSTCWISNFAQAPTITDFDPKTVCQGEPVKITGTNFKDATDVQLGSVAARSFIVNNATTITAIVADNASSGKIKVTTLQGSTTSTDDLTIKPAPIPVLQDKSTSGDPFTNCNDNSTYQLTVQNNSLQVASGSRYDIDWGDGSAHFTQTDWASGATTSHVYNGQGYFKIVFQITPPNGCIKRVTYDFYNGANPLASLTTTDPTTGLCVPATVNFKIGNWFNNSAGTKYSLDFGDGTIKTLNHPLNSTNTDEVVPYTYTTSSCPQPYYQAILKATNACLTTTYTLDQIVIRKKPKADFNYNASVACVNEPVCFTNLTIDGSSGVTSCFSNTDFLWDFGDGVTSNQRDPGCHQYAKAGSYTVKLSASNTACGSDQISKTIIIKPNSPPPTVSSNNITYCQNDPATPLSATGTGLLWYTTSTGGVGSATAPTPNTSVPGTTTYYVSQTLSGQCESPRVAITVTVNARPNQPVVKTPVPLCKGVPATPLTATGLNLLWYTTLTGGTGSVTAPTPSTNNVGTTYYYVSQTINNCEGTRATIEVNVADKPVAPGVVTPVSYCQNQPATPLTATGSNLLWYTTATGGTGTTTAPTPSTTVPGTTVYYVSQNNYCGESPRAVITVNVFAGPSATIAYSPSSLCNSATAAVVPVTITGDKTGSFSIAPPGLPIDAVTGSLTPANAVAGSYTITYTINASGGCSQFKTTTSVTVSSEPNATIAYPAICSSTPSVPPVITGTKGGTFSGDAGLVIDKATGNISPATSTTGRHTVTYTIAPSPPCAGFTTKADVTITKAPAASIQYNPSNLCNTVNAPAVDVIFTGDKGGTFTVQPAGLTINASTGGIIPAGAPPGTYTITYTINASGGCGLFKTSTTVSVSSTPSAFIQYPSMCSSDGAIPVVITGNEGGTFSSGTGLAIDKTTGTITPSASTPGTYTVKYSIDPSPPCPGFDTTTTVFITKAPAASISYNPSSVCNSDNAPAVDVTLTGDKGGSFTIQPASGLIINATTGKITPASATPGTYTITYTINASGGCAVFQTTTKVSVSSEPLASIQYPPICTSDGSVAVTVNGTQGGTFSAGAGLAIDAVTGTVTASASTPGSYMVKYSIAPLPPCPGFDTTTTVTITKAPAASISYQPSDLCNVKDASNPPVAAIVSGDKGGSFSIQPATGLFLDASSGTIAPAGATAGTYTITYTLKGTGGCKDFTTSTTVVVHSTPVAAIQYPGSPYCGGSSALASVTFTGTTGGIFSSAAGLSIDAKTGAVNPSLSKPGVYTVTYTIAPSPPCPGFDTTTKIEIAESPVISFDVTSQAVCSGETAVFKPTSTVANTAYAWSVDGPLPPNVSGVTSGTASGPDAVISLLFMNAGSPSEIIKIKVVPTNPVQNPCGGAPATITLTVNPIPAALKADTTEVCMHSPPVTLTATPDAGNTVKWYDANNNVLSEAPVINTTNPGQFIFYAAQVSASGCESAKAKFTAIVHTVAKIISSSYTNPTTCGIPSGSITLLVVDLNGNLLPNIPVLVHYTKFQTQLNMKDTTDATGKIVMPLTAGTYSDIYVETYGCSSQKIPDVFVLKDPTPPAQPIAGYNAPLCSESILNLSASSPTSSIPGPINYIWVGPAFGAGQDTTQHTVVSFPSASMSYNGTYIVYAMQNNCISPATSFQVVIKQAPTKPVINTKTPLCIGDNLSLQAFSSIPGNGILSFVWNGPGAGFPVNAANAGVENVKVPDGGVYTVSVTSAETGCTVSTDTLIQIGGYPVVKFSQDSLNVPTGYTFKLVPTIANASDPNILPISKYEWTPTQAISCNDAACSAPTITVKNNVCYSVKATNMYGCSGGDTICITTFCKNAQVFIPNAFTPEGLAENSRFMVRASGVASIKSFRVFNRWGRVVFERNNFAPNNPAYGWDGIVNGKPADMGVYVYTVEVVCENGTPYFYKGNVTLIR